LVEGKTCIVTGGAGSIGLATVRTLLAEGAKGMLVDLDADKLKRTVRELGTDNAAFVAADVTDAAQTRNYVEETASRWGVRRAPGIRNKERTCAQQWILPADPQPPAPCFSISSALPGGRCQTAGHRIRRTGLCARGPRVLPGFLRGARTR
jgi:hypothetical protein